MRYTDLPREGGCFPATPGAPLRGVHPRPTTGRVPSGPPWLSWKPGLEADTARRRRHLLGNRQLLPETTYSSGTKALPCLDPQGLLVQGLRFALIRQASWYKGSALRTTPCAGSSSCKQQCMQAACAEAPPSASPASTNGCKGHALVARRRQLLPATMAASGMH